MQRLEVSVLDGRTQGLFKKGSSSWSYSVRLVEAGKYRPSVSDRMFVIKHSFAACSRVVDSL